MIEVKDLVKIYGELRAVDGLNLHVQRGEILGLVGPNGAGKTTTLRCITGIVPPTEGRVSIAGFDLEEQAIEAKQRLAFVSDEPRLFDHLTARQHLTFVARLYGVEDGDARADALLSEFDLATRRDDFPSELSRGMKQKLMVAMGLLHRPEALLLDEPLTGLDPLAMRRMKDRIRTTAADGTAIVLSSHMLHLVEELCDRIAIIVKGRIALDGTLQEIRTALPELSGEADLEEVFMRAIGEGEPPTEGDRT